MSDSPLRFDAFELDPANALLMRDGRQVALPPKAFALLCVLAENPGKLATKDALLDAVWGHRHVSESVLKTTIAQVRAALADDAGEPRYIETVARRGYRFIGRIGATLDAAPVARAASTAVAPPSKSSASQAEGARDAPESARTMIGRRDALARLHASWRRAQAGERQLVWIAGEAGVGKTTLVDSFSAEVAADSSAHGQCVEQFGAGEPYLPVLEALKGLSRRDPDFAPLMRRTAPTWLVQMPWLVPDADRASLPAAIAGAGQERMVRELFELMERYTEKRPLLLVTEDLHWSDQGTLRLMDHFARRRGALRLLWVATFRLTQAIAEEHPLQQLRQELQLHRLSEELLLDLFSESEVADYVAARVPGQDVSESFVRTLHAHTDGLPLFVANVLDSLLTRGPTGSAASALDTESGAPLPVPDNLAGAVERQLAKLPVKVRATLEAASVIGMEFRAKTVADLLGLDALVVIESCNELARRQYWLSEAGVVDLSDGTLDGRYAFRHAVYRHVLYQRIAAAQRITFHRGAARSLERARGLGITVTPAELASHHELGREYRLAAEQYVAAAESALAHYAPQEALKLTSRGLELLSRSSAGTERLEVELSLLGPHSVALMSLHGVAARESRDVVERIREICDELPLTPARATRLNGIGYWLYTRGEYAAALSNAERIRGVASQFGSRELEILALNLMGVTLTSMGRAEEAAARLREGIALCEDAARKRDGTPLLVDLECSMRANLALPLAQQGLFDQSRAERDRALARADKIGQPMARMLSSWCACIIGARLGDESSVFEHSARLERVIATADVEQGRGPAAWFRGWILVRRGEPQAGFAKIMEGYSFFASLGMFAGCTEVLGYAAEAQLLDGEVEAARKAIDSALDLVEKIDERGVLPELLLIRARIDRAAGDPAAARATIERSIAWAQSLDALGSELKGRVALAELGEHTPADIAALRATHARITEGFDTPVCTRARDLLAVAGN